MSNKITTDTDHGHDSRIPLVLGTAQLGMNYGIANKNGKPGLEQALAIVNTAWENGIRIFDTAQAYGDSETILGRCFQKLQDSGRFEQPVVISKLAPNISLSETKKIMEKVDESIEKLGLNKLWGLMLHRESWFEKAGNFLRHSVSKLKLDNKIKKFGVSVYSPEKAIEALHMAEIDFIQVPFNVFDQRAFEYGVFTLAEEKKKKIFIRSVYLQGLLLLDTNQVPDNLAFSKESLKKHIEFAKDFRITPKLLALAFVSQKAPDTLIVIGSENPAQVKENIFLLKKAKEINLPDLSFLSTNDPKLINPSLWPN